jgi:hypothetical protein
MNNDNEVTGEILVTESSESLWGMPVMVASDVVVSPLHPLILEEERTAELQKVFAIPLAGYR